MTYWNKDKNFPTRKEMLKQSESLSCPDCNTMKMGLRWSKVGQPFFSCSTYPECKGTRNWMAEPEWPSYNWQDILKAEGVIDPERTEQGIPRNPPAREFDVKFWQEKFEEERRFVMQQLHDIKNAYSSLLRRVENIEDTHNTPQEEKEHKERSDILRDDEF